MKAFADAVDLTTLGAARDCPSARVRLTPYRPTLQAAGDGTEITSTVTNTTAITQVSTRLDLPDGWSAAPAGSTRTRSLAPFLTDSDGEGKLDTWAVGGSSYHPAWLKLVRDGTAYTAYASSDDTAWQQGATAAVPSASGIGDAGLVASAVNLNYPGQITTALCDSFSTHE
ncbi:hypothetical protein [Streptomyces sp. NPDC057580]|uniref:hypothetical protein n=1 Tax=Streptomyces sp. NPDC057580 TaxID=3346173 RepID=UPI0036B51CBA